MLCEVSDRLGGQARLAALPPGREEFDAMVFYLSGQMKKTGVEVLLNTRVTPEYVEEVNPDVVVMATGAVQLVPDVEGLDGPNVVMAWDVLTGEAQTGKRVAVIGGGATGIETATMLAEQGKDVTVVEMMPKLGADIGVSSRWVILQDADRAGVKRAANSVVVAVSERGVAVERDGEPSEILADTVVVAAGTRAVAELEADMAAEGVLKKYELVRIGDCAGPRKAFEAIREGFELGLVL
jgi:2,4-dienoyl-CoA reductase (NADPH2)